MKKKHLKIELLFCKYEMSVVVEATMDEVRNASPIDWYESTKVLLSRPRLDAYHDDLNKPVNNSVQILNRSK